MPSQWLDEAFANAPVVNVPTITLPGLQPEVPPYYLAGVDFGQLADYSALAIAERTWPSGGERTYAIRHLQRWPLGTTYLAIVQDVKAIVARPPLADNCVVAADATGVGVAVLDLLKAAHLQAGLRAISIHGGDTATDDGGIRYSVPKRDLVSVIQVLLQSGRLRIAPTLPDAEILTSELQAFEVKLSSQGHDSYGVWRENKHDDLVLAVAMACWVGEHAAGRVVAWF